MGAEINLWTSVTGIRISHGRVEGVQTPQGDVSAPRVIVAAGPWSRELLQGIGLDVPIRPMQHQVTILRRPQDLLPSHPIVSDLVNEIGFRPDAGNPTLLGVNSAGVVRLLRSSTLEVLDSEDIKLARLKGLREFIVVNKHAVRNALVPVITFIGFMYGVIIAAAITAASTWVDRREGGDRD
jgi:glycine/D-amino acid oxidase-like deaminating enzyme